MAIDPYHRSSSVATCVPFSADRQTAAWADLRPRQRTADRAPFDVPLPMARAPYRTLHDVSAPTPSSSGLRFRRATCPLTARSTVRTGAQRMVPMEQKPPPAPRAEVAGGRQGRRRAQVRIVRSGDGSRGEDDITEMKEELAELKETISEVNQALRATRQDVSDEQDRRAQLDDTLMESLAELLIPGT